MQIQLYCENKECAEKQGAPVQWGARGNLEFGRYFLEDDRKCYCPKCGEIGTIGYA